MTAAPLAGDDVNQSTLNQSTLKDPDMLDLARMFQHWIPVGYNSINMHFHA